MNESANNREEQAAVAVLMATFNGERWVREQVESILCQSGVRLMLYVSDDQSSDCTLAILRELASQDPRIVLLPNKERFGSAGKNFYRLLSDADFDNFDYVAFVDQDDIWLPNKLQRHVEIARRLTCAAVSSNVTAFWADGKTRLIDKSQPLRAYDYLFEAAGPGCSYLMSRQLALLIRELLDDPASGANGVALHDWLSYAVCRAMGWKWYIDPEPSVMYRQHEANVLGASSGLRAKISRLGKLRDGWYRAQVCSVLNVCRYLTKDQRYDGLMKMLQSGGYFSDLSLFKYLPEFRRKLSDRVSLGLAVFLGVF